MKRTIPICLATAMLAAACATEPPAGQLASSEAALSAALDAGAAIASPGELALAREKLELSRRWMVAKDYKPARWLAEQAQVDAELASLKALGLRGQQ